MNSRERLAGSLSKPSNASGYHAYIQPHVHNAKKLPMCVHMTYPETCHACDFDVHVCYLSARFLRIVAIALDSGNLSGQYMKMFIDII